MRCESRTLLTEVMMVPGPNCPRGPRCCQCSREDVSLPPSHGLCGLTHLDVWCRYCWVLTGSSLQVSRWVCPPVTCLLNTNTAIHQQNLCCPWLPITNTLLMNTHIVDCSINYDVCHTVTHTDCLFPSFPVISHYYTWRGLQGQRYRLPNPLCVCDSECATNKGRYGGQADEARDV